MIIQILNTINDDIKQIRTDVFMKEQGFENEFDEIDEKLLVLFKERLEVSKKIGLLKKKYKERRYSNERFER